MKFDLMKIKEILKSYPLDYMMSIFIVWLLPALYGLLNRYFIGYMSYESIVTDQSFEALEVLMEIFLEMFPLTVLALVAKKMHDTKSVIVTVKTAILMQTLITTGFVILNFFLAPFFIDWINTPISAQPLALDYFRLKICILPFQTLSVILIIAIKSLRKGKLAILIAFLGVLINYILDVLFISNYPFSLKLGLIGSAWNNILANIFLLLISGIVFIKLTKSDLKWQFEKTVSQNVLRIGKWNGLESLVRNIGYIIGVVAVVNFIGGIEPEAIGGYNTAMWVMWGITLIPVMSWTEATQIAIGNAYGNNNLLLMKNIQKVSTGFLGIYMISWIIFGWFFWTPISQWLNQGISMNVALYSTTTFYYLIIPYLFYAIGSGLKTVFIGTGIPQYVFIPSAIVNLGIYIPLGIMVSNSVVRITYGDFLIVTIVVFVLDFLFTVYLLRTKGYKI